MADSFPMFELNKPVSEDDDGHVEFDLNDPEDDDGDAGFALHEPEDDDGHTSFALHEPEDDDGDAAFDLNDPSLEHGNSITFSLVHVLCYLFLSIISHIIASYFDRI